MGSPVVTNEPRQISVREAQFSKNRGKTAIWVESRAPEKSSPCPAKEAALIRATQARLPQAEAKRLKQLGGKSERGTLTEKELDEYRALAQRAEQFDVTRVEALAALVIKLKGNPVHAVMEEIGWEGAPVD